MITMKTAISLNKTIYQEMAALARRLDIPRSRLFAMAAEEFLQRHKKKDMQRRINGVVSGALSREDTKTLAAAKRKYKQLVEGQW